MHILRAHLVFGLDQRPCRFLLGFGSISKITGSYLLSDVPELLQLVRIMSNLRLKLYLEESFYAYGLHNIFQSAHTILYR